MKSKLDKKLFDKWIENLRNGNYQQIRGNSWDGEKRCSVLGVLCDLINSKVWHINHSSTTWGHPSTKRFRNLITNKLTLPTTLLLMKLNNEMNFKEIADKLEKEMEFR